MLHECECVNVIVLRRLEALLILFMGSVVFNRAGSLRKVHEKLKEWYMKKLKIQIRRHFSAFLFH